MSNRILITGASGLLGRHLLKAFSQDPEWQTLGLAFSRAKGNLRQVDLTNPEQVSAVVKEFKPSVILHSAAERRPDIVEKDQESTKRINEDATQHLCDMAKDVGAYVLFISTDYVFDGTKPPYKTGDAPNPLNKYGLSKAAGEKLVMNSSSENMVLRVPILYGEVEYLEESPVTILFKNVKNNSGPAEMNHCERRYPSSCGDIAQAAKILLESRLKDPEIKGIFHWGGNEMMTKYDMALAMAETFGLPSDHMIPYTTPAPGAARPFDCCLDYSRLEALGATSRTPFKEGIKQCLSKYYP